MELSLYYIDAFASELFEGNPEAVCPLDNWLPDELMQLIALDAKFALVARSVLGVDTMTDESIKIFSSKKDYDRLVNIETSTFESMARENNSE